MDVGDAANIATETIPKLSEECIGKRTVKEFKSTHPWLTEEIIKLKVEKANIEGTAQEAEAILRCSEAISKERCAYMMRTKEELEKMKSGSKLWWKTSGEMLGKAAKVCSTPALRKDDGSWIMDGVAKAGHLAQTFANKNKMPEQETNKYSRLGPGKPHQQNLPFPVETQTMDVLKALKSASGTGPDELPARILNECAEELALPITILATRILATSI